MWYLAFLVGFCLASRVALLRGEGPSYYFVLLDDKDCFPEASRLEACQVNLKAEGCEVYPFDLEGCLVVFDGKRKLEELKGMHWVNVGLNVLNPNVNLLQKKLVARWDAGQAVRERKLALQKLNKLPVGLYNIIGTSCNLNAALQILTRMPGIKDVIVVALEKVKVAVKEAAENKASCLADQSLILSLMKVVRCLYIEEEVDLNDLMSFFKEAGIHRIKPEFDLGEVLTTLLGVILRYSPGVKSTYTMVTECMCYRGKNASDPESIEPLEQVVCPLPILEEYKVARKISLETLFMQAFEVEHHTDEIRTEYLLRLLPNVLLMSLPRLTGDERVNLFVDIPEKLNLEDSFGPAEYGLFAIGLHTQIPEHFSVVTRKVRSSDWYFISDIVVKREKLESIPHNISRNSCLFAYSRVTNNK